jgi:hypothetical protein
MQGILEQADGTSPIDGSSNSHGLGGEIDIRLSKATDLSPWIIMFAQYREDTFRHNYQALTPIQLYLLRSTRRISLEADTTSAEEGSYHVFLGTLRQLSVQGQDCNRNFPIIWETNQQAYHEGFRARTILEGLLARVVVSSCR